MRPAEMLRRIATRVSNTVANARTRTPSARSASEAGLRSDAVAMESRALRPRGREANRSLASGSPSPGECTTHERPGASEHSGKKILLFRVFPLKKSRGYSALGE